MAVAEKQSDIAVWVDHLRTQPGLANASMIEVIQEKLFQLTLGDLNSPALWRDYLLLVQAGYFCTIHWQTAEDQQERRLFWDNFRRQVIQDTGVLCTALRRTTSPIMMEIVRIVGKIWDTLGKEGYRVRIHA